MSSIILIHDKDLCRNCGYRAAGHTVGVFSYYPKISSAPIEFIWRNEIEQNLNPGCCNKFIPKDNLKYLRLKYEGLI